MTTAGLRELRQRASELVRQADAGETITISVSGRAVAELGPVGRDVWRTWAEVVEVFDGSVDADWVQDRDLLDQTAHDPFRS